MEPITIGDVVIANEEQGITFRSVSEPGAEISVQARGAGSLFDFLRSSSVNPATRRRGFRISLEPADGLRATVANDETSVEAVALDISLSGVRLEAVDPSAPGLEVGALVDVTLHLGDESTTLRSEIRHSAGARYGILFLDALAGDEPAPPPAFARMIARLERRWLADHVMY